jgi:hypothetical protein
MRRFGPSLGLLNCEPGFPLAIDSAPGEVHRKSCHVVP